LRGHRTRIPSECKATRYHKQCQRGGNPYTAILQETYVMKRISLVNLTVMLVCMSAWPVVAQD